MSSKTKSILHTVENYISLDLSPPETSQQVNTFIIITFSVCFSTVLVKQDLKRCILGEHNGGEKQRAEAIERCVETGSERMRGRQMEGENGKTWRLIKGEEGAELGRGRKAKTCRMHRETGKNELEKPRRFFQRRKSSYAPQGQNDPLHFPVFPSLPFFQPSLSASPILMAVSLFIPPSSYLLPIPLPLSLLLSCSSHTHFFFYTTVSLATVFHLRTRLTL